MNGRFSKAKKVLAAAVGALMTLQCAAVCAEEIAPEAEVFTRPEIQSISAAQVGANYIHIDVVTEGAETDRPIVAYFVDGANSIQGIEYSFVVENEANIVLGVSDATPTGTYTLTLALNLAGEVVSMPFTYVGSADVEKFFAAINEGESAEAVEEALDESYPALSVVRYSTVNGERIALSGDDYTALTAQQKTAFAQQLFTGVNGKYSDKKGSYNAENVESFVKEALLLAIYNCETTTNAQIAESLYKYDSVIGFDSTDEKLYARIEDHDTFAKIVKNMANTVNNVDELAEIVRQAAAVELVNETAWTNLVNIVDEQNDVFGISEDDIASLKADKSLREKFCKLFNGTYYSIEDLVKAWDDSLKTAGKPTSNGGGGGGTTTTTPEVNYKEAGDAYKNQDTLKTKKKITDYYKDMGDYAWASDAVLHLTESGVVQGYGEEMFGPSRNLTRAEFMKMLVNAIGLADVTAKTSFTDVKEGEWYYVYVASAEKYGLATGYGNGLFGVNDPITRQDLVTLIYRAAKLKNLPVQKYSIGQINFKDKDEIAPYALEAVKGLYGAGVYLDTTNVKALDTFEPTKNASRAYAAVILDQMYMLK